MNNKKKESNVLMKEHLFDLLKEVAKDFEPEYSVETYLKLKEDPATRSIKVKSNKAVVNLGVTISLDEVIEKLKSAYITPHVPDETVRCFLGDLLEEMINSLEEVDGESMLDTVNSVTKEGLYIQFRKKECLGSNIINGSYKGMSYGCYFNKKARDGYYQISVTEEILGKLGLTREEALKIALKQTLEEEVYVTKKESVYILSNIDNSNGTNAFLNTNTLQEIRDTEGRPLIIAMPNRTQVVVIPITCKEMVNAFIECTMDIIKDKEAKEMCTDKIFMYDKKLLEIKGF